MKIRTQPEEIWKEYQRGIDYKEGLDLYKEVERNEEMYNGRQWKGVIAPSLPHPVVNFLKPVINYYIAMLVSDDIAANIESDVVEGEVDMPKVIAQEIDNIMERENVRTKNRRLIRNCAVDGDACLYCWFDPETEEIAVELIDNTNVYFGNTMESEVQKQPYLILARRELTELVREEAEQNGCGAEGILPDNETQYISHEQGGDAQYTTVLTKMWKQDGTVRCIKCTKDAMIKKEVDTEYRLYPVAWMSWEGVKNCYHGVSPVTAAIPNQIFVNKLFALAMIQLQNLSFPTILYDMAKLPNGVRGGAGNMIGVSGSPDAAMISAYKPPDMSAQVAQFIDATIRDTKETMGASDAALGNVKPDNTSAIVAVQKAAGLPLDLQRMDFYACVESYVRIWIDMMRVNYGVRDITITAADGTDAAVTVDFATVDNYLYNLTVDIGQAAYWSELTQLQTLDNLMKMQIIPDALTYLEGIPDGYLKGKQAIVAAIKERMAQEQQMQQGQQMAMQEAEREQGAANSEIGAVVRELLGMEQSAALEAVNAMEADEQTKAAILQAYERAVRERGM